MVKVKIYKKVKELDLKNVDEVIKLWNQYPGTKLFLRGKEFLIVPDEITDVDIIEALEHFKEYTGEVGDKALEIFKLLDKVYELIDDLQDYIMRIPEDEDDTGDDRGA